MSEATLEVPGKYRDGIQSELVDFRDDALATIGRSEIGMSEEPPEFVAQERRTAEAVTPLVEQGLAQLSEEITIYKGSAEWIGQALNYRAAHVSEVLHGAMNRNEVDHGRVREKLEELGWLNDAGERLKGSIAGAVAA